LICDLRLAIEKTVTLSDPSIANRKLPQLSPRSGTIANLLSRPLEQRIREYKYRFSQSIVFGLPVIALQIYGRALGPTDSERWVSLLQALLAGWVLYVNLGMLFEGILLLPMRRVTGDFIISIAAVVCYLYSLISAAHGIATSRLLFRPLLFHVCVIVLAAWSGWRWWRTSRGSSSGSSGGSAT
jgi:cation transport ATPase